MPPLRETLNQIAHFLDLDPALITNMYKTAAALAGALVLWVVLGVLLRALVRRLQKTELFRAHVGLVGIFHRMAYFALIFFTGTYLIRVFNLRGFHPPFYALVIVLVAGPVKDFLRVVLDYLERNLAARTSTDLDNIVFNLLNRFMDVIVYATAIVLALDLLGVNVMPFIAGAGVAGVAIGFAAKDTLSNLIAGVLLIIDRPFEVGDRIEVWRAPKNSATWGDVIDIGLRATKIRTTDNIVVIIPNNVIMTRDIINYTTMSAGIRVRVNIGVAYDADIDRAKELICGVAAQADWISDTPAPKVVVRNFGESSVDLQARVWIADARRRMDTISYLTDTVNTVFSREGIDIPFPTREITIKRIDRGGPADPGRRGGEAPKGDRTAENDPGIRDKPLGFDGSAARQDWE